MTTESAAAESEASPKTLMYKPFSRIVDLTHEMYNGMPNIGGVQIAFWPIESHDGLALITGGKLSMESRMMLLAEHCGTHLDAPRHFDKRGQSLSELPLEKLVLPGHLLDFTHKRNGEAISIADFEAASTKLQNSFNQRFTLR